MKIPDTLSEFVELHKNLDIDTFLKTFSYPFLIAIGFISSTNIKKSHKGSTDLLLFNLTPTHDNKARHPLAGKIFHLIVDKNKNREVIMVGRDRENDIVIPDQSVSFKHAELGFLNKQTVIQDLKSTNGTFINMNKLPPNQYAPLEDEDIVTFGRYSFQFYTSKAFYHMLGILS